MKTFNKIFVLFLFFTAFPFFVDASIDGVCSSANGQAFYSQPSDLCSAGTASDITGTGPWSWTCSGSDGGVTASCGANKIIDGVCSSANGQAFYNLPSNLCSAGSTSSIATGDTSWSWTCNGINGGTTASCGANKIIDGVCGLSNGLSFIIKPIMYLCSAGITGKVIDYGPWNWMCGGINGGTTAYCNADKTSAAVNGVCGLANNQSFVNKPEIGLCYLGTASSVYGDGPWIWRCDGNNGGITVYCSAQKKLDNITNGVCGLANKQLLSTEPVTDLCFLGTASSVYGDGPWIWTCNGSNGGTNTGCYANKKITTGFDGDCGSANTESFSDKPTINLCLSGTASIVSGDGPWIWICIGIDGGKNIGCYANKSFSNSINGECGSVNGKTLNLEPPTADLCSSGTASSITIGDTLWGWTCDGINGGTPVSCSANKASLDGLVDGVCGSNNGQSLTNKPINDLCFSGTASIVSGDGPWSWTCNGINGGTPASCGANKASLDGLVDGACGSANGKTLDLEPPTADLCSSGTASSVAIKDTSWNWTCNGINGGATISCSTSKIFSDPIDGACGSANGKTLDLEPPTADLCSAGTAAGFSGNGYGWHWACNGTAGGSQIQCYASKISAYSNAICGLANGQILGYKPFYDDLCSSGSPTNVIGTGPWYWSCVGGTADNAVECSTERIIDEHNGSHDGVCGYVYGTSLSDISTDNLCFLGSPTKVIGTGPWYWTCNGIGGGKKVSCYVKKKKNNGVCGSANGKYFDTVPITGLCSSGDNSNIIGTGPWYWNCGDEPRVSCSANKIDKPMDGVCGLANGRVFSLAPTGDLCSVGTASSVTGTGPWYWTCSGIGGGADVSCNTYNPLIKPINGVCGSANRRSFITKPIMYLCSSGWASNVYGTGPWIWVCFGKNGGKMIYCSADKTATINGVCGLANDRSFTTKPIDDLCSLGTVSSATGTGPWYWTCGGIGGGTTASCSAQKVFGTVSCGVVNNTEVLEGALTSSSLNLCNSGNVVNFQLSNSRYYWKCDKDGMATSWCSAKIISKSNGVCGTSNGKSFSLAPTTNLCISGISTDITNDNNNWYWKCKGINGGNNADCSAIKIATTNGQCGSFTGKSSDLCKIGDVINFQFYNNKYYWRCSDKISKTISVWCMN
ncbi:MAG: hypothetical protein WC472_01140 [Candidatus Paceibacterota bacterium]